ncbi:RNA helicase [Malassezia pachydermatis]
MEDYAKTRATIRQYHSWNISPTVMAIVREAIQTRDARLTSPHEDIWAWLLHVWSKSAKQQDAELWPTMASLCSAYEQQGDDALTRACAQSFLSWLQREIYQTIRMSSVPDFKAQLMRDVHLQLVLLRSTTDLRAPALQYSHARSLTRQLHLHVGPTNSGKTYGALVALSRAKTGIYAGPLRLLAHEVWDRLNHGTVAPSVPPRACNLRTGEEVRVVDEHAGLVACTVEMADVTRSYDVAVIDEIQMIADPQRGFAWTQAVLGLPAKELHLCGEASAVPLLRQLAKLCGDDLHVHEYQRLTPLEVASHSLRGDLSKIERGDCVVAFSRSAIFQLKEQIEAKTGLQCAVAYGALPPETKSEQAKLFNAGKLDVMVASDAIGMGLNLRIKRVVFDTLSKWNGTERVPLSLSQIKQIAGRAGRYGTSRDEATSPSGLVLTRHEDEMDNLRAALAAPVRPITHASLQPTTQQMETLSLMLPHTTSSRSSRRRPSSTETTVSTLLDDVKALARLDVQSFTLADFETQKRMSPIIEARGRDRLTQAEKEKWANTPVNFRDERAVEWVGNAIELYAQGSLVEFEACAENLGTMEAEEAVAIEHEEAKARQAAAQTTAPVAVYATQDESVLNIHTLMLLESLHRTLTLYLWLGFRFPLAFCFRADVEARKLRTEASIQFCLEAIRVRRARRLTRLGRGEEAKKWLRKHLPSSSS